MAVVLEGGAVSCCATCLALVRNGLGEEPQRVQVVDDVRRLGRNENKVVRAALQREVHISVEWAAKSHQCPGATRQCRRSAPDLVRLKECVLFTGSLRANKLGERGEEALRV